MMLPVRLLAAGALLTLFAQGQEGLYNGIRLPAPWPPRRAALPSSSRPPYLISPPPVVPIDVGRQLFVDDFLIEKTDLTRTFHQAEYYSHNPVLEPDQPWESDSPEEPSWPTAMPYSDGAWFDAKDRLFKLWYMCGYGGATCYAESKDGIHWKKPKLDVRPGTNIVIPEAGRGSTTVWLDHEETDPARRFKFVTPSGGDNLNQVLRFSPDGIHWTEPVLGSGSNGDRSTVFFNPFRQVWVYSIKTRLDRARARAYREAKDFLQGASWNKDEPVLWAGADELDPPRPDLKTPAQLYNLDAVAYESLMLGLFTIWRGQPSDRPKPNELHLGFSRDGFHFDRPERRPFLAPSEQPGAWNRGNVQSAGGGLIVMGDKLHFYVSGRAGAPGGSSSGKCSTGLAMLRRDGFASMRAQGAGGMLTTRPVIFNGGHLFVNASLRGGELRAEVLDKDAKVIGPFAKAHCRPVNGDATKQEVSWKGGADLRSLGGQPVRFRFTLTAGDLYSFWVSPDRSGVSHGYIAGGGPAYAGNRDVAAKHSNHQ